MRAKILTINNQKGGVGKTTAVMNISSILANKGSKVLVIDAESQNNLTTGFLPASAISEQSRFFFDSIYGYVTGKGSSELPIVPISENLDLVPSSRDMAGVEGVISSMRSDHLHVFRQLIRPYLQKYDYILFDIPPTPGLVTLNTYMAADFLFIVAKLEDDSYAGAVNVWHDIYDYINPHRPVPMRVNGVFFNEFDTFPLIHRSVKHNFEEMFGTLMLNTSIRRNTAVKVAKRAHKSIVEYDPTCHAAKDYLALTAEIEEIMKDYPVEIINKYGKE